MRRSSLTASSPPTWHRQGWAVMDGAHTHGHGPTGLGELVVLALGVVLAADILARVLTFLLIVLAVAGGLLVIGLVGYVVVACRRYRQATG